MDKKSKILIGSAVGVVTVGATVGIGVGVGLSTDNNSDTFAITNSPDLIPSLDNNGVLSNYTAIDAIEQINSRNSIIGFNFISARENATNLDSRLEYSVVSAAVDPSSDGTQIELTIRVSIKNIDGTLTTRNYSVKSSGWLNNEAGTKKILDSTSNDYVNITIAPAAANKTANQLNPDDLIISANETPIAGATTTIKSVNTIAGNTTSVSVVYEISRDGISVQRSIIISNIVPQLQTKVNQAPEIVPTLNVSLEDTFSELTNKRHKQVYGINPNNISRSNFNPIVSEDTLVRYEIISVAKKEPNNLDDSQYLITIRKSSTETSVQFISDYQVTIDNLYTPNEWYLKSNWNKFPLKINTELAAKPVQLVTLNEFIAGTSVDYSQTNTKNKPDRFNVNVTGFSVRSVPNGEATGTVTVAVGTAVAQYNVTVTGFMKNETYVKNVLNKISIFKPEVIFNGTVPQVFASELRGENFTTNLPRDILNEISIANNSRSNSKIEISLAVVTPTGAEIAQRNKSGQIQVTLSIRGISENNQAITESAYTKTQELQGATKAQLDTSIINYFVNKKEVPVLKNEEDKNKKPTEIKVEDFQPLNFNLVSENPRANISPLSATVTQIKSTDATRGSLVALVTITNDDKTVTRTYEATVTGFDSALKDNTLAVTDYIVSRSNTANESRDVEYTEAAKAAHPKIDTLPSNTKVSDFDFIGGTKTTVDGQSVTEHNITINNKTIKVYSQIINLFATDSKGEANIAIRVFAGTTAVGDRFETNTVRIVGGFQTTVVAQAKSDVEAVIRDLKANPARISFSNTSKVQDQTLGSDTVNSDYTVTSVDSKVRAEVTNIDSSNDDGSVTLTIRVSSATEVDSKPAFSSTFTYKMTGFATTAKNKNREFAQSYANSVASGIISSTEATPDLNVSKLLTLVNTVTASSFNPKKVKFNTGNDGIGEVDATLTVLEFSASQENDSNGQPKGEGTALVEVSIGTGTNVGTATYNVIVSGFPNQSKIENQKIVDQYAGATNTNKAIPFLIDSNKKQQATAANGGVLTSDYRIEIASGIISGIIKSVTSKEGSNGVRAVITVEVAAGNGSTRATATYIVEDDGFLSVEKYEIYQAAAARAIIIDQAAKSDRLSSITNVIRLAPSGQNKSASAALNEDIIITSEEGSDVKLSAQILSGSRNNETGDVTFKIKGTLTKNSVIYDYTLDQEIKARLFLPSEAKLVQDAPRLTVDWNEGADRNISAVNASIANFHVVGASDSSLYDYTINSITSVPTGENATEGNTAAFTIRVSLKTNPSVTNSYTVTLTGFIPTAQENNAKIVNGYIKDTTNHLKAVASDEIKKSKAVGDLVNTDITIEGTKANLSFEVLDINPASANNTTAVVTIKVTAGTGINAYSNTYNQTITGFLQATKSSNEKLLTKYIASENRDNPVLLAAIQNAKDEYAVANLQTSDFTITPRSTVDSQIGQSITNLQAKVGTDTTAVVTVTLTLGTGSALATKTYTTEFPGFASAARANAIGLIRRYESQLQGDLTKYNQPILTNSRKPQEVALSSVVGASNLSNWNIAATVAGHPLLTFTVSSATASDTPNAVDVTVLITANANDANVDSRATKSYVITIPGFLTDLQSRNFQIASTYRDRTDRITPTLLVDTSRSVKSLTTADFSITQPSDNTAVRLSVFSVAVDPVDETVAVVTVRVSVGNGTAISNSVTYSQKFEGFRKAGLEDSRIAVEKYLARNSAEKSVPVLNNLINKEQTSGNSIIAQNFSISQPINNNTDPEVVLSISKVTPISNGSSVEVTIRVAAGAGETLYEKEEKVTVNGFATNDIAQAWLVVNNYIASGNRVNPVAKPNATDKQAANVTVSDFTLDTTGVVNVTPTITSVKPSSTDDTVVEVTITVTHSTQKTVSRTYISTVSGFSSAQKAANIAAVKAFIENTANKPTLRDGINKAVTSVQNLIVSDYVIKNNTSQNPPLSINVTSIVEKGESAADQKIARVTWTVSAGSGLNFATQQSTFEESGFADRATGAATRSVLDYINSQTRNQVQLRRTVDLQNSPDTITAAQLTINAAPTGSDVNLQIGTLPKVTDINQTTLEVPVIVTSTKDSNISRTYISTITSFFSKARVEASKFATLGVWPAVFKTDDNFTQNNLYSAEELKSILPSSITSNMLNIGLPNPAQTSHSNTDRTNIRSTIISVVPNNDQGALTVNLGVSYIEDNQIGAFEATYSVTITGLLTSGQAQINNAVQYQFRFSGDRTRSTASSTVFANYNLEASNAVLKNLSDNDRGLTYSVTNIEALENGVKARLTIRISGQTTAIPRTYLQTIDGFLTKTKFDNLQVLTNWSSIQHNVTLQLNTQNITTNNTAITEINKISTAISTNNQTLLETYFNNYQTTDMTKLGITRTTTNAVAINDSNGIPRDIKVTFLISVGQGDDIVTLNRDQTYFGFADPGAGKIFLKIQKMLEANESGKNQYIKVKQSSVEKILTTKTAIGDNFFTVEDFEVPADKQTELTNEGFTFTRTSVSRTTRENVLTGSIIVNFTLAAEGATQNFSMQVKGFRTASDAINAYKEDITKRLEVKSKLDNNALWTKTAETTSTNFETIFNGTKDNYPLQNREINNLIISVGNGVVNTDTSKVDFIVTVSKSLETLFSGAKGTINLSDNYISQVNGFKRTNFGADAYRYQDDKGNFYSNTPTNPTAITKLEVNPTKTSIEANAFRNSDKLVLLTLNEGLTSIGANAFSSAKITLLDLPKSLMNIGDSAFTNSPLASLTGLDLTKIEYLKENVFAAATTSEKNKIHDWKFSKAELAAVLLNSGDKDKTKASEVQANNFRFENSENFQTLGDITFSMNTTPISDAKDEFGALTLNYTVNIGTNGNTVKSKEFSKKVYGFKTTIESLEFYDTKVTNNFDASNLDTIVLQNKKLSSWKDDRTNQEYNQSNEIFRPSFTVDESKGGYKNSINLAQDTISTFLTNTDQTGQILSNRGGALYIAFKMTPRTAESLETLFSGKNLFYNLQAGKETLGIRGTADWTIDPSASRWELTDLNQPNINWITGNEYNNNDITRAGNLENGVSYKFNSVIPSQFINKDVILEIMNHSNPVGTSSGLVKLTFLVKNDSGNSKQFSRYAAALLRNEVTDSFWSILGSQTNSAKSNIYSLTIFNNSSQLLSRNERTQIMIALATKWTGVVPTSDNTNNTTQVDWTKL
ncbi:lipoprotein-associated protein [Mycoplasma testudineum]|uniref:Lipoprotein-associated protein n=1 Tax=Mycoplasma testudineum TaxID=244584 RepID=A0A4R6IFD5_9MOLU|nr:leucine-rich repeat domain-containing protein [Mycoplasma testudineum]OYD26863.1 hypothetical protein CG473_02000 [Mycoplasma testudineum]TDO20398.1 lipoprotein-associated protein [Mycoplasma testudineum]